MYWRTFDWSSWRTVDLVSFPFPFWKINRFLKRRLLILNICIRVIELKSHCLANQAFLELYYEKHLQLFYQLYKLLFYFVFFFLLWLPSLKRFSKDVQHVNILYFFSFNWFYFFISFEDLLKFFTKCRMLFWILKNNDAITVYGSNLRQK